MSCNPEALFGSAVLGKQSIAARLRSRGRLKPQYLSALTIVGEELKFMPLAGIPVEPPPPAAELFDRSVALTGPGALARLSGIRVAVVGASGPGSIMIELLMRTGVWEIVVFDFDRADITNLNRVLHLRARDAEARQLKSLRFAEVVNETGLQSTVTIIGGGDIRDDTVAQELRACDLIFGCVDRDWPRLIMSEVAYQYLIPYIDLGSEVGATETDVQSVDARVSLVGPGRPCLVCSKAIRYDGLRPEGLEDDEKPRVLRMGYSAGLRLRAPSVMDLNMRSASAAMLFAGHMFQPFLAAPLPHSFKEAVTNFSIRHLIFTRQDDCPICGSFESDRPRRRFPFDDTKAIVGNRLHTAPIRPTSPLIGTSKLSGFV